MRESSISVGADETCPQTGALRCWHFPLEVPAGQCLPPLEYTLQTALLEQFPGYKSQVFAMPKNLTCPHGLSSESH